MVFFYLLLAHLIADFLLQPQKLVRWKHTSWKGTALHTSVHFLVSLVLVYPIAPRVETFVAVLFLAASHFLVDWGKVVYQDRFKNYFTSFLIDQCIHVVLLFFAAMLIGSADLAFLQTLTGLLAPGDAGLLIAILAMFVVGAIWLILITSVYDVSKFEFRRAKNSVYKPDRRGMLIRFLVGALLYALFLALPGSWILLYIVAFPLSPL